MSSDHHKIRHRSIITPVEIDQTNDNSSVFTHTVDNDPVINTATTTNCTNDEEIARQYQEQFNAQNKTNTDQKSVPSLVDTRPLAEIATDAAFARKLQEEEYSRKSIPLNRSHAHVPTNNHGRTPTSTAHSSRIIQRDAELAAQLQQEEEKKQRQRRLGAPTHSTRKPFPTSASDRSSALEIMPIPPFNQRRQQQTRRDLNDDNAEQSDNSSTHSRSNQNVTFRVEDVLSMFQQMMDPIQHRSRHLEHRSDDFGPDDYEHLLELDKSVSKKPLSSNEINRLPTERFRQTPNKTAEERTCNICWDEFEDNQVARRLPCLHCYHKDCIDTWLKSSNTCPICRIPANQ